MEESFRDARKPQTHATDHCDSHVLAVEVCPVLIRRHISLTGKGRSGNGLVSYYINLVLEGVGITNTRSKAAINGGLQVRASRASKGGLKPTRAYRYGI